MRCFSVIGAMMRRCVRTVMLGSCAVLGLGLLTKRGFRSSGLGTNLGPKGIGLPGDTLLLFLERCMLPRGAGGVPSLGTTSSACASEWFVTL